MAEEGDNNTRFFHESMKARFRRNAIITVHNDVGEVGPVLEIKKEIKKHLETIFECSSIPRPHMQNIQFSQLSCLDVLFLMDSIWKS